MTVGVTDIVYSVSRMFLVLVVLLAYNFEITEPSQEQNTEVPILMELATLSGVY